MDYKVEITKKIFGVVNETFSKLGVSVSDEVTNRWVNAYVESHNGADALTLAMVSDAMLKLSNVTLSNIDASKRVDVYSAIYNVFASVGLLDDEVSAVVSDVVSLGKVQSESYFVENAKMGKYLKNN